MTRPVGVPLAAEWFFDSEEWLICERDELGELHGSVRSFRRDGTPWVEFEYRHGKRHGPFVRYYASGHVAQAGRYYDDLLDGLVSTYSNGQDPRTIRECCVPAAARVMRQEHRRGQLLAESFYDAAGNRVEDAEAIDADERVGTGGARVAEPALAVGRPLPKDLERVRLDPARTWPEPLRERENDVLCAPFDFWGFSRESLPAAAPEAARVEQSLSAMREAVYRAALRVQACDDELVARGAAPLPVDVTELLREGTDLLREPSTVCPPPRLRRFSFTSEDGQIVRVDETLTLSESSSWAVALRARIEWAGLCALSWACGLERVALPARLTRRPALHAMLLSSSERQAALSGPGFSLDDEPHFHGLDESLLPASALTHLAEQYREVRAMLLFATDPECQSPWQDDLGRETS